jgi:hypothetical protein
MSLWPVQLQDPDIVIQYVRYVIVRLIVTHELQVIINVTAKLVSDQARYQVGMYNVGPPV